MQMRNSRRAHGVTVLLAVVALSSGCSREATPPAEKAVAPAPSPRAAGASVVHKVSPAAASRLLAAEPGLVVVDVRTAAEYDEGHLPGARRVVVDSVGAVIDAGTFPATGDQPLLVYCRSGGRSARAADTLAARGFEVYDLDGGVMAWDAEGLPLEQ